MWAEELTDAPPCSLGWRAGWRAGCGRRQAWPCGDLCEPGGLGTAAAHGSREGSGPSTWRAAALARPSQPSVPVQSVSEEKTQAVTSACIARMARPPTSGDLIPPPRPSHQPLPAFQPEGRWGRACGLRTAGHWDHPGTTRTGVWSRGGSLTSLGREPSPCAALPHPRLSRERCCRTAAAGLLPNVCPTDALPSFVGGGGCSERPSPSMLTGGAPVSRLAREAARNQLQTDRQALLVPSGTSLSQKRVTPRWHSRPGHSCSVPPRTPAPCLVLELPAEGSRWI